MPSERPYLFKVKTLIENQTTEENQLCLRVGKVAEMLDCSQSKVYGLIQEGHLEAIRLSGGKRGGTRVLSSSLNRFLREGGVIRTKEMSLADKVNSQGMAAQRRTISEWI